MTCIRQLVEARLWLQDSVELLVELFVDMERLVESLLDILQVDISHVLLQLAVAVDVVVNTFRRQLLVV